MMAVIILVVIFLFIFWYIKKVIIYVNKEQKEGRKLKDKLEELEKRVDEEIKSLF